MYYNMSFFQDLMDAEAARQQTENELAELIEKFNTWLTKRQEELAQLKDITGNQDHAISLLRHLKVRHTHFDVLLSKLINLSSFAEPQRQNARRPKQVRSLERKIDRSTSIRAIVRAIWKIAR
jgi:hypothetical protein